MTLSLHDLTAPPTTTHNPTPDLRTVNPDGPPTMDAIIDPTGESWWYCRRCGDWIATTPAGGILNGLTPTPTPHTLATCPLGAVTLNAA